MKNITILGAGSWGTALYLLLRDNGHQVRLWSWQQSHVAEVLAEHENRQFLPGVPLPGDVEISSDMAVALVEAEVVVFAVPSHVVRSVAQEASSFIPQEAIIVNVAKGFEKDTLLRLSQVLAEELPTHDVVVLSGPSHAEEVAKKLPTTVVVSSLAMEAATEIQSVFMSDYFRIYTNDDIIGVELGGALKNIIALGAGIVDGLGMGDNTKAALMTRGLAEMARLGEAMGAKVFTFAGLTGIGDLIVTCGSMHSRNRRAGILLGKGHSLEDTLKEVGMVVEGVNAVANVHMLRQKYNVSMPISEMIYRVLFEGMDAKEAILTLMTRDKASES
ncbi:MAG: NAD(P)H-dependent glycerol-3-phosphate dehydrogenase [Peptococcaceae bacterium]|nr:NAD(P)H-dependent glycerol-3-phosphate dehydrogenase [Peptococcaceae bacterium]